MIHWKCYALEYVKEFSALEKGSRMSYNQLHNILRLFDVLPNFAFPTSETMGDYYL